MRGEEWFWEEANAHRRANLVPSCPHSRHPSEGWDPFRRHNPHGLAIGETLAGLIPFVDPFWKPLIAAGQTGDPAAAGRELMIEASAEGIFGAVEKVGGLYGKTLAEAIKRAGLLPAFKVAKKVGFNWAGKKLRENLRPFFDDPETSASQ